MEKELIKLGLNVLNLIIAQAANNPERWAIVADKVESGRPLTIEDLGFLSDETDALLDAGERM
jgi:hypothetical protein